MYVLPGKHWFGICVTYHTQSLNTVVGGYVPRYPVKFLYISDFTLRKIGSIRRYR